MPPLLPAVLADVAAAAGSRPLLVAGVLLLVVGLTGLLVVERRRTPPSRPTRGRSTVPSGRHGVDTRIVALVGTLRELADHGMDPPLLLAFCRARAAAVIGIGAVDESRVADEVDDGTRFVLSALADGDVTALQQVPPQSARVRAAVAAVDEWWAEVHGRMPAAVRSELDAVLASGARQGGITDAGRVD